MSIAAAHDVTSQFAFKCISCYAGSWSSYIIVTGVKFHSICGNCRDDICFSRIIPYLCYILETDLWRDASYIYT